MLTTLYLLLVLVMSVGLGFLYRKRGGAWSNLGFFKNSEGKISTTEARLQWAIPAGIIYALPLLCFFDAEWYSVPVLILLQFAVIAFFGHGAHMNYDYNGLGDERKGYFIDKNHYESITKWIYNLYGGYQDSWSYEKKVQYNMVCMSFIGFVRNSIVAIGLSILSSNPVFLLYGLLGLLDGPIYRYSWKLSEWFDFSWHEMDEKYTDKDFMGNFNNGAEVAEFVIGIFRGLAFGVVLGLALL